jgi:hypothetical protein
MVNVVVPLRFGAVSEARLPLQASRFYAEVFGICGLAADVKNTTVTLPISLNYEHRVSPDGVAQAIMEQSAPHEGNAILIDVGGPDERDVCRPNIIRGIANAIYLLASEKRFTQIFVFFSISISDKDVASGFLYPIAKEHDATIIFGNGTGYGLRVSSAVDFPARVQKAVRAATADVVQKLRKKLVRHVGYHFFDHSGEVVPHLFDGGDSADEIYEILHGRMTNDRLDEFGTIYFDCEISPWFEGPFIQAATAADILTKVRKFNLAKHASSLIEENACLYTPIIRTGSTIKSICQKIRGLLAGNERLFFSLLSTKGNQDERGKIPIPVVNPEGQNFSIKASYDVLVADVEGDLQRVWKAYKGPKPVQTTEDWKLSSCANWGMILEAGLIVEKYKPEKREFVGYVPDSGRLAELNGPFIAKKISAILLQRYGVSDGANVVFVCPDETHALKIVQSLRELSGCSYIPIPRDVIDRAAGQSGELNMASLIAEFDQDSSSEGLKLLQGVAKNPLNVEDPDVVLFDEFSYSRATIRGLKKIVTAARLDTKCTICLLDLNEGAPAEAADFYALYDLDYSKWVSTGGIA